MALNQDEILRYSRHLIMPEVGVEGQEKLKAGRVLLIGTGGLGSPAALYLAAAGVGTIGIIDNDVVDYLIKLNRSFRIHPGLLVLLSGPHDAHDFFFLGLFILFAVNIGNFKNRHRVSAHRLIFLHHGQEACQKRGPHPHQILIQRIMDFDRGF